MHHTIGWRAALVACVMAAASSLAGAQVSPQVVEAMRTHRDAWFDSRRLDLPSVSREITGALSEAKKLEADGGPRAGLARLMRLEKYAPFDDFPSFEVHMLASYLALKLGDAALQRRHMERATAFAALLAGQGSGSGPDDPVRLIMVSEITDWVRAHGGAVVEVKTQPWRGRELLQVTYSGPSAATPPRNAYVELDPRTQQMAKRRMQRFSPLALTEMQPAMTAALQRARATREAFIEDRSFDYISLRDLVNSRINAAITLDSQGKPEDALAALLEIEKLRPIEEIPTPRLLSVYSYLVGKTGNALKQRDLRAYIFGVQQAIAHSGDGRSQATAIHVILLDEEYEVLADRGLKRLKQSLVHQDERAYDVITTTDRQGAEEVIWFDITAIRARERESTPSAVKN